MNIYVHGYSYIGGIGERKLVGWHFTVELLFIFFVQEKFTKSQWWQSYLSINSADV